MGLPGINVNGSIWLLLLSALADVVRAGEYCFHYHDGIDYCTTGCCGRTLQERCCLMATWSIVLLVIGGLILMGVAIFICFFYYCKKRGRTTGRVVYPANPQTTVATVVQYPAGYTYPSAPMVQPPPYTPGMYYQQGGSNPQPGQPPPPLGGSDANQPTNQATSSYGQGVYDANQYSAGNKPGVNPAPRLDPAYPPMQPTNLYST